LLTAYLTERPCETLVLISGSTLGELALHVASVPGAIAEIATQTRMEGPNFTDPSPKSASELVPALDQGVAKAKRLLGSMDDTAMTTTWRLMRGDP
jgi:hypothetical protein